MRLGEDVLREGRCEARVTDGGARGLVWSAKEGARVFLLMCRAAVGSSWKSGPRKAERQKAGGAAGALWDLGQILEPQALPASERRAPFRHVTPGSENIRWRAGPPVRASCSLRDARFQLSSPWSEPTFDRWVELTVSQDWRLRLQTTSREAPGPGDPRSVTCYIPSSKVNKLATEDICPLGEITRQDA